RRRHTRFKCDWSSDVCSSDLVNDLELTHLLRRLIGESIELKVIHGRDLGVVKVDQGQLEQVIINLAVNARDAMTGGGTLTIRTRSEERRVGKECGDRCRRRVD